jgi:hypothetical protein
MSMPGALGSPIVWASLGGRRGYQKTFPFVTCAHPSPLLSSACGREGLVSSTPVPHLSCGKELFEKSATLVLVKLQRL